MSPNKIQPRNVVPVKTQPILQQESNRRWGEGRRKLGFYSGGAEPHNGLFVGNNDCKTFRHSAVQMNRFHHNVPDNDYFKNIANTPDIGIVNETLKNAHYRGGPLGL